MLMTFSHSVFFLCCFVKRQVSELLNEFNLDLINPLDLRGPRLTSRSASGEINDSGCLPAPKSL